MEVNRLVKYSWFFIGTFFVALFGLADAASAAGLSISPAHGSFVVGSTFTASVLLNTEGESINTIGATITFPADKLQVVSPSAGNSIINLWTTPPYVENQTGRIVLQGGVPGGITASNALITMITFRVKSVGNAIVKFADASKVLLNDGKGTDALKQTSHGIFQLVLPPPAGPLVISETHPDQGQWYNNPTVILRWGTDNDVDGFSYILNDQPLDIPDDISEGAKTAVTYRVVPDGQRYFHIKSLKDEAWGGTTHFALRIDVAPPAAFPIEIIPRARSTRRQPVFQFATTDALSGLNHYEFKLIPLRLNETTGGAAEAALSAQPFFVDVLSPYITSALALGAYDVVVRAYDNAGNYRETKASLSIVTPWLQLIGDQGLLLRNTWAIPWPAIWASVVLSLLLLIMVAWRVRRWHHAAHNRLLARQLPDPVQRQLNELQQYRSKYGKLAIWLLFFISAAIFLAPPVRAEVVLAPPIIESVSRDISNQDIFYVGGQTDTAESSVIVYLQNINTNETISEVVISDKAGQWFYRHNGFLSSGSYLLWVQQKLGGEVSPPSPQIRLTVKTTALQFGASRLSFEVLYLFMLSAVLLAFLILVVYIIWHARQGRHKHRRFRQEVREAQESVRRGFAVLRRDIEAELAVVKKIKMSKELSAEENTKEAQLLKDLHWVEQYIGKEIWDIELVESRN